jgi:hypothetical protein
MKMLAPAAALALAVIVGSVPAMAQSSQGSAQPGAADQFKSAGQHISEAAQGIGQGIKQGAIQAWEAVKAGASAADAKLNGRPATPAPPQASDKDSH